MSSAFAKAVPALPENFKLNNHASAVEIKPSSANESTYLVDIKRDWCMGLVPHGGYLGSILAQAATYHSQLRYPKRNQPDLITLHTEFIERTFIGPAEIVVTDIKPGRQFSTLRVQLFQHADADLTKEKSIRLEGLVRQGNLENEKRMGGVTLPTRPMLNTANLPKREDCTEHRDPPLLFVRRTAYAKVVILLPPGYDALGKDPEIGGGFREQWISWRREGFEEPSVGFDIASLAFLADAFIPLPEAYNTTGNWFPTLNYGLEVKRGPPVGGWQWLFMRIDAHIIRDGRCDINVSMFDEVGDLVALSKHAALIVPSERNIKKKGGML